MQNNWLTVNARPLVQIKRFLVECEYKPEFEDFPLRPIQKLFNGAEAEIGRLQNEVESLRKEIKRLSSTEALQPEQPKKNEE
jgi:hypothetical protein